MKGSFILFAVTDLVLLGLTAVMGLVVEGSTGFAKHFLLGVLSGLFTCLVHVVVFMYFVVQDKVMKQALAAGDAPMAAALETDRLKAKTLRAALAGIGLLLVTIGLGAAIGQRVPAEAHLVSAFACIAVNGAAFMYQHGLLVRYRAIFDAAFPQG
jgi:hypothetical protein